MMIFSKFWRAIMAQFNKLVNMFRSVDPVAEMQYECDLATNQIKEGRRGLEQYRGLVERVARQVADGKKHEASLAVKVQSYLNAGDRAVASKFALELEKEKIQVSENEQQLRLHEEAYENNLVKIKHANHKILELRERIAKYDATLKLSKTEAEIAKLVQSFDMDVTTDMGQVEQLIQEQIDTNRGAVRVAADLSNQGLDEIKRELMLEQVSAEQALLKYEASVK